MFEPYLVTFDPRGLNLYVTRKKGGDVLVTVSFVRLETGLHLCSLENKTGRRGLARLFFHVFITLARQHCANFTGQITLEASGSFLCRGKGHSVRRTKLDSKLLTGMYADAIGARPVLYHYYDHIHEQYESPQDVNAHLYSVDMVTDVETACQCLSRHVKEHVDPDVVREAFRKVVVS